MKGQMAKPFIRPFGKKPFEEIAHPVQTKEIIETCEEL